MNEEHETVLDVEGMSCGSCVRHVTDALTALDGVDGVEVKLRQGVVVVRHDPEHSPVAKLIGALDEAGYPSREHRG